MSNSLSLPANYWRASQKWNEWIGKQGTVIVSTIIRVSSDGLANQVPYAFVLVDFGDHKAELMGADDLSFEPGEKVYCVLRKMGQSLPSEIVPYGIKVVKGTA